ncbi:hypothetical protein I552_2577 [Mycobacterium xenopi 3993]|nr:hypothetical protein I552_2577 [Mycobacterium xenopi 3993]
MGEVLVNTGKAFHNDGQPSPTAQNRSGRPDEQDRTRTGQTHHP